MEDSSRLNTLNSHSQTSFGMSSFGTTERQKFGQNVRLAMACIESPTKPTNSKAMPSDEATIHHRLKALSQEITSSHADLLELLVRYDELEGWKTSGASHCAAWMNLELGISMQLGWEFLRVGRKLRLLPTTTALFRAGKLSWSKIRLIVNVADADNEKTLCHAALDASVTEVKRLCNEFRWAQDDSGESENQRALKQWDARALLWDELSTGSTRIQLILPPEIAQAFLNSVEHSLNQLDSDSSETKISQRRADAAILMAETSLQVAGRDIATADRYQVIVSMEATEASSEAVPEDPTPSYLPSKRPAVKGASTIAQETAKRIACDCSISTITKTDGEPTDIGRKSRLWPNAMTRAIKDRDQHCQFYGCTHTQNLQIHHIVHWANGGTTSVENGVCLCHYHHTLVHEGGYSIRAVANNQTSLNEQFSMQQHVSDASMFDFEKELRNNNKSFNKIRKLSPTTYRFRVFDNDGRDIRGRHHAYVNDYTKTCKADIPTQRDSETRQKLSKPVHHYGLGPDRSTRVECAEPKSGYYQLRNTRNTYQLLSSNTSKRQNAQPDPQSFWQALLPVVPQL